MGRGAIAAACVSAVGVSGELSAGALVAVAVTGLLDPVLARPAVSAAATAGWPALAAWLVRRPSHEQPV